MRRRSAALRDGAHPPPASLACHAWPGFDLFPSSTVNSVILRAVFDRLPEGWKQPAKGMYRAVSGAGARRRRDEARSRSAEADFVRRFFASRAEYDGFVDEFRAGPVARVLEGALEEYRRMTGRSRLGDVGLEVGSRYYALVRKLQPRVLVETGVCNGVSSMCLLLAVQRNGFGRLYSVDFPYRANESLEDFRQGTFDRYGGAAIPRDKEPGWIIPAELRSSWELHVGKSQRELPRILLQLDGIDFFVHDSEHSAPCMMFEYEMAWEWLRPGGVIVSDDIDWNDAYATFCSVRHPDCGLVAPGVGFMARVRGSEV